MRMFWLAAITLAVGCTGPTASGSQPTPVASQPAAQSTGTSGAAPAEINAAKPCQVGQVKASKITKLYHLPGGKEYALVTVNVECFANEAAALAAGYKKSPN